MARILIVDNEPSIRSLLADVLRFSGYGVSVACCGGEALEIAAEQPHDLVMLDVNLPGFDGWATLDRLRVMRPDQKVLMMSGFNYAAEALDRGVGFLAKPYRPSDVLVEVERTIGGPGHVALDAA